jgi:hypothetical protein
MVFAMELCLGVLGNPWLAGAQEPAPSEDQVKAAYLVNFIKYVDWPAKTFARSNAPVVVGIWGEERVAVELKKMTEGKIINGHPFLVEQFEAQQEPKETCQIMFVSASEKRRMAEMMERFKQASELTVGETELFLSQGRIINFTRKDRKVRLEINLGAAEKAGLKISSKLLSVAEVRK